MSDLFQTSEDLRSFLANAADGAAVYAADPDFTALWASDSLAVLLGFRNEELGVMVSLCGAPVAVSSYPMAEAMCGDGPLAASQVVLTTIFSMGTLFVLIYLGKLLCVR